MKKLLYLFFLSVMLFCLACCSKSSAGSNSIETETMDFPTEASTAPVSQPLSYSIYLPNATADSFETEIIHTDTISADTVLSELIKRNVLPNTVSINSFGMDNGMIRADFNQAFADVVCSMGTSGEFMIVGSVVNTFLDAFQAESIIFTVDGEILESGHTIYDYSMTFFDL